MPRIQLRYLAPICDIAGTYREVLTLEDGETTLDLIKKLCERYGQPVRALFYDASGSFRPMFIILRNARAMAMEDLMEPLEDGDTIVFVPPIAGG